jgi:hypothetical protein
MLTVALFNLLNLPEVLDFDALHDRPVVYVAIIVVVECARSATATPSVNTISSANTTDAALRHRALG